MRPPSAHLLRPIRRSFIRSRPLRVRSPAQHFSTSSSSAFASSRSYASASARRASAAAGLPPAASMHTRTFSAAAVAVAAVAGGAYYYRPGVGAALKADAPRGSGGVASESPFSTAAVVNKEAPTIETASATQSQRRTLVIDQDSIYANTHIGDGPLSKGTDEYGRNVLEMLSPEQATAKLRKNEESWLIERGTGVVRYDVVQMASNNPIEDDHAEKIIQVPDSVDTSEGGLNDWMFWGVFDGHSGWTTSARLRQNLISFVARELNNTYTSAKSGQQLSIPTPEEIDDAIKKGFLRLDNEIVYESVNKVDQAKTKNMAASILSPALSGSCALLSFYESRSKTLRVACTGDSRAVLGRKSASGKWTATPLSVDQTGANEAEAARIRAEHPGEPNAVMNGRVLGGLEPSRAFGDAVYKWTQETQKRLKESYFARTPNRLFKTPPYVTAEPVVTTTQVQPEMGDFVVMATDGLWEMLTNEEVIGLVGKWLEAEANTKKNGGSTSDGWLKSWFASNKQELPVERPADWDKSGNRDAVRQQQWGIKSGDERFVVEDRNAATHLIRNAMGGRDRDQVCALLTLPAPMSRRYRDDLTVEVIFFGEEKATGNVSLNKEASAGAEASQPKL